MWNCLLGWAMGVAEITKNRVRGPRSAKAAIKGIRILAPKSTGGSDSMKGQTCPP